MRRARADRVRSALLGAFFAIQVLGIARARLADDRYFAWAPLHEVTELRITVVEHGRALPIAEVRERYALPSSALAARGTILRELNDVDPLLRRVERIECARPAPADVRIALIRNGEPSEWLARCPR